MSPLTAVVVTAATGSLIAFRALHVRGVRGATLLGYTFGMGPLVGQGLASLPMFYWRLTGWHRPGLIDFLLVSAVAFGLAGWASRGEPVKAESAEARRRPGWIDLVCTAAMLAAIVRLWDAFVTFTGHWPQGGWDAVAIWNVRAKTLYRGYDLFPTLVLRTVPGGLAQYPLLLPGMLAAQYAWTGTDAQVVPQLMALVNLAGMGVLLFTMVADRGDRSFGAAAVAMLWAPLPVLLTTFSLVADVLVAYAMLAAFAVLSSLLPRRTMTRLPAALGGWCLGLLCWTKIEGVPLAIILTTWFVVSLVKVRRAGLPSSRELTALVLAAMPGAAAVWLFKWFWIPATAADMYLQGDWLHRLTSAGRWSQTVDAILDRAFPFGAKHWWSHVWSMLTLAGVISFAIASSWRSRVSWYWALTLSSIVAFWLVTYAATPFPLDWQLETSLDRLMVQAYPLAIAGVCGTLGVQFRRGYTQPAPD